MTEIEDEILKEATELEREKKAFKFNTDLKKMQFISQIKSGLGVEIKKNPKPKVIKQNWFKRLVLKIKKMF